MSSQSQAPSPVQRQCPYLKGADCTHPTCDCFRLAAAPTPEASAPEPTLRSLFGKYPDARRATDEEFIDNLLADFAYANKQLAELRATVAALTAERTQWEQQQNAGGRTEKSEPPTAAAPNQPQEPEPKGEGPPRCTTCGEPFGTERGRFCSSAFHITTADRIVELLASVATLEARLRDAERLYPALRHVYETRDSDTWATAAILDFLLLHDSATAALYPDYAAWLRAAPRGDSAP